MKGADRGEQAAGVIVLRQINVTSTSALSGRGMTTMIAIVYSIGLALLLAYD